MTEQAEKEFQSEFYDIELECDNCGARPDDSVNIPMGAYWDTHIREINYRCSYCGCSGRMVRV